MYNPNDLDEILPIWAVSWHETEAGEQQPGLYLPHSLFESRTKNTCRQVPRSHHKFVLEMPPLAVGVNCT